MCSTVSGPSPFRQCVFPFKHNGFTYYGCPIDPDDRSKRWCSTLVDESGNHIVGKNKYGHCSKSCPIHRDGSSSQGINMKNYAFYLNTSAIKTQTISRSITNLMSYHLNIYSMQNCKRASGEQALSISIYT